jgi:uncharacterized protein YjbI with pentapeptide repeats
MPTDENPAGQAEASADNYTDPTTGKRIIYDDAVPTLLRGDLTLTADEQARVPELNDLFNKAPLTLAAEGAEAWNLWVKANHERWLEWRDKSDHILVLLKCISDERGIFFNRGQKKDGNDHYTISQSDFNDFIFPCTVSFMEATFSEPAIFSGAIFSGAAEFSRAIFSKYAVFHRATFSGAAEFGEATFSGTAEQGSAMFTWVTFSGDTRFNDATFSQHTSFHEATFSLGASFDKVVFDMRANFKEVTFKGVLSCQYAVFLGQTVWDESQFSKTADFSHSQFLNVSSFMNCGFKSKVDFDRVAFGKAADTLRHSKYGADLQARYDNTAVSANSLTVPNFRGAHFAVAPNLGFTHVAVPPMLFLRWYERFLANDGLQPGQREIADADAASKLRVLGELANRGHHHLAEKRFFRAELLCRRGHEATSWREVLMINLFELFSECGLSFRRPMFWLLALALLCGAFYQSQMGWVFSEMHGGAWFELGSFTFLNSLPLIGYASDSYGLAADFLYGGKAAIPYGVRVVTVIQNIASAVFLFFSLLAVRNYFKLG